MTIPGSFFFFYLSVCLFLLLFLSHSLAYSLTLSCFSSLPSPFLRLPPPLRVLSESLSSPPRGLRLGAWPRARALSCRMGRRLRRGFSGSVWFWRVSATKWRLWRIAIRLSSAGGCHGPSEGPASQLDSNDQAQRMGSVRGVLT